MNRGKLFFLLGALSAWLWISPIFVLPGEINFLDNELLSARMLRQFCIFFIIPLVIFGFFRILKREVIPRLLFIVFIVLPLPSVFYAADLNFLIFAYGPFCIGGLSILILASLREAEFRSWLTGLSFIACVYLIVAMTSVGLGYTSMYGRERASFGFIHPTQTSAVILMASLMPIFLLTNVKHLLFKISAYLIFLWLLYEASSKNTLLLFLVVTLSSLCYKKIPIVTRLAIGLLILSSPFIVFFYAIFWNTDSYLWQLLNWFSSERLAVYKELMSHFNPNDFFDLFLGPCLSFVQRGEFHGFASSESVYFSILANFGLITLTGFIFLLFLLVVRLSKKSIYIGYPGIIGLIIFYAIDSQGVTTGNLTILILLASVVRESLKYFPVNKVSPTTKI